MSRWGSFRPVALVVAVLLAAVTASAPVAAAAPARIASSDDGGSPASYIVVLRHSGPARVADAQAHAARFDVQARHVYGHALSGYSAELTPADVAALRDDPDVAYVERDGAWTLEAQPVPTGVRRVFGPDNPNTGIGAATDRRVDVDLAVIDGGVNDHPDLDIVDRVDCMAGTCAPGGYDEAGHGTHVAGIAAAVNDEAGVVGTAPGARIWSVKVCAFNTCPFSAIVAGIDYATAHADRISVANMSVGGTTPSQAITDAVTAATDAGVLIVAAAGNDNVDAQTFRPANHPDVVTVAALADSDGRPGGTGGPLSCRPQSHDDQLADYSNWGATIEVVAPGTCITSTWNDDAYHVLSGTSMAAPHVTGAAALLASAHPPANRADALALRSQLMATGNTNWTWSSRGPGDVQRPLLDLHATSAYAPVLVGPPSSRWRPVATVPGPRAQFGQAQCAQDPTGWYTFGGNDANLGTVDTTWRYDLAADTWQRKASVPGGAGAGFSAVCAPDGKVHVLAQISGSTTLHRVYDPETDGWSTAAPLPRATTHAAIAAWGGKVYVFGGLGWAFGDPSAEVDVYDLASDSWSTRAALPEPVGRAGIARQGPYAYVVGGWGAASPGTNVATVRRFDLRNETWSTGPSLTSARADVGLVATDKGLYALGGYAPSSSLLASEVVERLDTTTWPSGSWQGTGDVLPTPVGSPGVSCAGAGPNAVVRVGGGLAFGRLSPTARSEHARRIVYGERCAALDAGAWQPAAPLPDGRVVYAGARCSSDPGGYWKFAGWGAALNSYTTTWRYDLATNTWAQRAPIPTPSVDGAGYAATCVGGKIHLIGGPSGSTTGHFVYDIATDTWTTAAPLPRATQFAAIGAWGGKVYVLGGLATFNEGPSAAVDVYDIATDTWSSGPAMPEATGLIGYAQSGSRLYLVGGQGAGSPSSNMVTTRRFDMATGVWSAGPALPSGRSGVALVATDKALYAVGGFARSTLARVPVATVERLDLASWPSGSWTRFHPLPAPTGYAMAWCAPSGPSAVLGAPGGLTGSQDIQYMTFHDEQYQTRRPAEACAAGA